MADTAFEIIVDLCAAGLSLDEALVVAGYRAAGHERFRALVDGPCPETPDLAALASDLCRSAAPELAAVPLYLVLASQAPADLVSPRTWGNVSGFLDWHLRSTIGEHWSGRGPAMIVNDVAILAHAEAVEGASDPDQSARDGRVFRSALMATVCHELAHLVEQGAMICPDAPSDSAADRVAVSLAIVAPPTPDELRAGGRLPFHRHGARFVRALVHLVDRFAMRGVIVHSGCLLDTSFGLDLTEYAAALGDEPARMRGESFATIRATTPPRAFVDLWHTDVDKHLEQSGPITDSAQQRWLRYELSLTHKWARHISEERVA